MADEREIAPPIGLSRRARFDKTYAASRVPSSRSSKRRHL
jgi:hypothetical protein